MKKCNKCKKQKDYKEFRKDKRTTDGYYTYCHNCQRAYQKQYDANKKKGTIIAF